MEKLKGKRALVTGGSRGLGLGIIENLVEQGAEVTVLARNPQHLADAAQRLNVKVICGDINDEQLSVTALTLTKPDILVLNAGAIPVFGPINKLSWEDFNRSWNIDVKAGFHWLQAALNMPLPKGSRVIIGSSGAALNNGSPLSGSYAGAKRMLWLLATYANGISAQLGLDIRFQAIVPMQIIGETELGGNAAEAYGRQRGIGAEAVLKSFGSTLPPSKVGAHVVSILTNPQYQKGVAYGLKGDVGITLLDD